MTLFPFCIDRGSYQLFQAQACDSGLSDVYDYRFCLILVNYWHVASPSFQPCGICLGLANTHISGVKHTAYRLDPACGTGTQPGVQIQGRASC